MLSERDDAFEESAENRCTVFKYHMSLWRKVNNGCDEFINERNTRLDLSAIAVDLILDAERMFGRNSEDFLEKAQRRNRRN
jgi:hypothetical protein